MLKIYQINCVSMSQNCHGENVLIMFWQMDALETIYKNQNLTGYQNYNLT